MIYGEVETSSGDWIGCDFLIDTGGDVTVLAPAVLQKLGRPTTIAAHQLGGVGGSVPTLEVWTTIRFLATDGSYANIGGTRSAFGQAGAIEESILGFDLLRVFALIVDRPSDTVCLLHGNHSYIIQGS